MFGSLPEESSAVGLHPIVCHQERILLQELHDAYVDREQKTTMIYATGCLLILSAIAMCSSLGYSSWFRKCWNTLTGTLASMCACRRYSSWSRRFRKYWTILTGGYWHYVSDSDSLTDTVSDVSDTALTSYPVASSDSGPRKMPRRHRGVATHDNCSRVFRAADFGFVDKSWSTLVAETKMEGAVMEAAQP